MKISRLAAFPVFALSLSAAPLPFNATVDVGAVVDITGSGFYWHIGPQIGFSPTLCTPGVFCAINLGHAASSVGGTTSVYGSYGGRDWGFSAQPVLDAEYTLQQGAVFGNGVTVGDRLTLAAIFVANIVSPGLDLRFTGSGTSTFVVAGVQPDSTVLFFQSGDFSGSMEQAPEPAVWQLATAGLALFGMVSRLRTASGRTPAR